MDLDTGVPVVRQAAAPAQDVDAAGFGLAPGWGPLTSLLTRLVPPPAAGGDGILVLDLDIITG